MSPRIAVSVVVLSALALNARTAVAQAPASVKAAQDATRQAKAITYALYARGGSGESLGTVTLQRIGSTHSRIRVELKNPAAAGARATLHPGSDCTSPRVAAMPHAQLLNPFSGRVSETVVALPLNNLQSGKYLLDVQNATARQRAIDACANLAPNQP